jgi:hypothetical protein
MNGSIVFYFIKILNLLYEIMIKNIIIDDRSLANIYFKIQVVLII